MGLGIVGQLTAQFYQLAGNYVIGWDMIERRNCIAPGWGIDETVLLGVQDDQELTHTFSKGMGLDSAVLAFGGDRTEVVDKLTRSSKRSPDGHPMGQIVIVGGTTINLKDTLWNVDIRRAARTGPGYHDEDWERGLDYPTVFIRWTTRTNMELCIQLISEGKLDVDHLTTHTIPLENVEREIAAIIREPDEILGVIFQMNR